VALGQHRFSGPRDNSVLGVRDVFPRKIKPQLFSVIFSTTERIREWT
jgi:hypothetical protein